MRGERKGAIERVKDGKGWDVREQQNPRPGGSEVR
jgi:hypothetical protein